MPPVTAIDLITPTGDIDPKLLFPGAELPAVFARLESWLNEAYGTLPDVTVDNEEKVNEGARAFAYFKAFDQAYKRMSLTPLRSSVANEASDAYDMAQVREVAQIAQAHKDSYDSILEGFALAVVVPQQRVSSPVKTQVTW